MYFWVHQKILNPSTSGPPRIIRPSEILSQACRLAIPRTPTLPMDYDSDGALANVPPPTLPPIWITIGLSRASFFIFFGRLFVYAFMSGCCHCIGLQVRYMSVYSTIHHQWLQKREENIKNIGGDQTSGRQVKGTGKRPNSEHGRPRTQKEQARDPKKNAEG